jgi:hypothetical protein
MESGEVQEGLTEVTFTSRGVLEGGWRLLGFFTDAMMGPSFEESLTGLKARVESAQ